MQYLVFNTLSAWESYESIAHKAWIEDHPSPNEYTEQTTSWSSEQTRITDGKYICHPCPSIEDHSAYTLEESDDTWFPTVEEI